LKTHKIRTKNEHYFYSSRVTGDIRIIWQFDEYNQINIIMVDFGGHDEVY
jgi:mRNA-degrading endonuclease YafQ of YafQ-DinJ toxin-antitoxin module